MIVSSRTSPSAQSPHPVDSVGSVGGVNSVGGGVNSVGDGVDSVDSVESMR